jgi:hypothetical protein
VPRARFCDFYKEKEMEKEGNINSPDQDLVDPSEDTGNVGREPGVGVDPSEDEQDKEGSPEQ